MNSSNIHIRRNVDRESYANLMKHASFIIGNSSSGILEAPTFKLPAINIGRRQIGRFQSNNVINVDFDKDEIIKAIHKASSIEFKNKLQNTENPYGDGNSSERIVEILKNININSSLVNKNLTY